LKSLVKRLSFSAAIFCFFYSCPSYAAADGGLLKVPPVIRVESGADVQLPITTTSDPAATKAMVVIRGIPWNVSLTTGRLFPSGVWALKASEAQTARFVTASNTQQAADLMVSLVTLDGDYLSNATTRLEIAPGNVKKTRADAAKHQAQPDTTAALAMTVPNAMTADEAPPRPGPQQQVFTQAELDKVFKLMDRGDQHLAEGKIASARRFYQLAVDSGWPDGALAIARTYDAEFLKRFPIVGGIEPNAVLAKQWYNTAREISLRPSASDLPSVVQR
jgi:hypothetical protein